MKINGEIYHNQYLFSVNKVDNRKRDEAKEFLSSAAEVLISKEGNLLSEANSSVGKVCDGERGEAESKLEAAKSELAEKKAKKKQVADIEEQIATDDTLTDKDKAVLQEQATQLKKESMTDEDKLYELYDKKYALEADSENGTVNYDLWNVYNSEIKNLQEKIKADGVRNVDLEIQANQERSDRLSAGMQEKSSDEIDNTIQSENVDGLFVNYLQDEVLLTKEDGSENEA